MPQGLLQEVKGLGIKKQRGASQLGTTAQKAHALREVVSRHFPHFLDGHANANKPTSRPVASSAEKKVPGGTVLGPLCYFIFVARKLDTLERLLFLQQLKQVLQ